MSALSSQFRWMVQRWWGIGSLSWTLGSAVKLGTLSTATVDKRQSQTLVSSFAPVCPCQEEEEGGGGGQLQGLQGKVQQIVPQLRLFLLTGDQLVHINATLLGQGSVHSRENWVSVSWRVVCQHISLMGFCTVSGHNIRSTLTCYTYMLTMQILWEWVLFTTSGNHAKLFKHIEWEVASPGTNLTVDLGYWWCEVNMLQGLDQFCWQNTLSEKWHCALVQGNWALI